MLPLWSVLALTAAMATTAVPLLQEKFKADGFSLALWNKVFLVLLISPCLLYVGFPQDSRFYMYAAITAVIYSISDVIYFRAVPLVGSGTVTRLLPVSVIITFFVWFAVDPSLLDSYRASPGKSAAIGVVLAVFLYCASRLKRCTVSWQGFRMIWPVILAACVGPVFTKLALTHAGAVQAPFAFIFVQGVLMVACLSLYQAVQKPVPRQTLLSRHVIRTGIILAIVSGTTIFLKTKAVQLVDNPGFVSLVFYTDALWVLLVYRLTGRRETANIWAGLGIVACAAAIILIKTLK